MAVSTMRFEWFEQGYLGDTGTHPAEAEIRRIALTGKMLDGSRGKPIHIDELGGLVDLITESQRPEVQRVVSRSFGILVKYNLKDSTEIDLTRETEGILKSLEELAVETGRRVAFVRKVRSQLHAISMAALGSSPKDSIRLLQQRIGWIGAEQLVESVMGVTE
jgi:hypothetical protein